MNRYKTLPRLPACPDYTFTQGSYHFMKLGFNKVGFFEIIRGTRKRHLDASLGSPKPSLARWCSGLKRSRSTIHEFTIHMKNDHIGYTLGVRFVRLVGFLLSLGFRFLGFQHVLFSPPRSVFLTFCNTYYTITVGARRVFCFGRHVGYA